MKALEKRIAARLLSAGVLTEAQLEAALKTYTGDPLIHKHLVNEGFVSARDACRHEAEASGLQFIDLDTVVSQPEALAAITAAQAWQHHVLPIWQDSTSLTLAMVDPNNLVLIDDLRLRLRVAIVPLVAEAGDLLRALNRYYGPNPAERPPRSSREVPKLVIADQEPVSTDAAPTEMLEGHHRNINSTKTQLELPKLNVNTVVDELRRKSGSGEISHREFQRRLRELREENGPPDNDSRGLNSAATRFEESSQATLAELEQARMKRGAYEPPTHSSRLTAQPDAPETPAVQTVERLLDIAVEERAIEIEFTPTDEQPRVRLRKGSVWVPVPAYSSEQHGQVIGRLRLMAGLELKPRHIATEHQFLLPAARAHVLCTLHLEKTVHGERALVRLAESAPLMEEPLSFLALPGEEQLRLHDHLHARGGGLLLVTAPHARTLSTVYASFLAHLGRSGQRDILSLERPNERRLPGVTPINCPSEEILLASLANASFMNPDVLGIQSIENGTILNRVINLAFRGTTTIGAFPAPNAKTAQACLHASKTDAMNVMRGLMGHLHITELPRLCASCRRPVEVPETLPGWARNIEAPWYQRAGCTQCGQTGYQGTVWITEFFRPDLDKGDGSLLTVVERSRDVMALALAGEIDPREVPLTL